MRISQMALSAAIASALIAGHAWAEESGPPTPVRSTSLNYFRQDTQPSPSDVQVAPPSPSVSGGGYYNGCDSGCDAGGCDSCGCSSCDCLCGDCEPFRLFPEFCCGTTLTGWMQAGYHDNSTGLFNSHPDRLNLHQFYLALERAAETGGCCWDFGYRFDVVYGTDAQDTQAFGNNPGVWDYQNGFDHGIYGWALPQAYFEFARGDLSVKVGHFYTISGYEVVPAPGNFFYSHALTMYNSEPFTHTGVLASYAWSDYLTIHAGWTLGWDTGYDQFGQGNSLLAGFSYSLTDDASFSYIMSIGDFGARGEDGYHHSIVFDWNLTDRLEYVLLSDYTETDTVGDLQYGAVNYLFYTLNDCWKLGGRVEWWKAAGVSNYEATAGLNWSPHTNLVVRPEIRQDWTPATDYDETIFGVDAYILF